MSEYGDARPVLVTGATGKQGGATAKALFARGVPVRALVRNPDADAALALAAAGAELVKGDLGDKTSLDAAAAGARAVFSVQMPDMTDLLSDAEMAQGRNLVEAALRAGVPQFVHTSVADAGANHRRMQALKGGKWDATHLPHYFASKVYIEDCVKAAGFQSWTILQPGFFMENLVRPSFLFENWTGDRLATAILPESVLALIAVADIGLSAADIFADPARFNGLEIPLTGERLSLREVAAVLSEAMGLPLEAPSMTVEQAIEQGIPESLALGAEWQNEVGSSAAPETARQLGLSLRDFRTWAHETLSA